MDIAIPVYDGFTALDAVGPYEVLSRIPGASVTFVAAKPGPPKPGGHSPSASIPVSASTDNRMLTLLVERSLEDVPRPDVVLVPGGRGDVVAHAGESVREWVRTADRTSAWTTSVCTGSLILAAAGLLAGKRATSHWLALDRLRELDAEPVSERVVFDGKLVTAAGVSAGIDMALMLAARIAGDPVAQAIQLGIEYDPQPPFDAGSPSKAPSEVVEAVRAHARASR